MQEFEQIIQQPAGRAFYSTFTILQGGINLVVDCKLGNWGYACRRKLAILSLMTQITARPFLPGENPPGRRPLERFLPPLAEGVVRAWLNEYLPPGSWVLDPLGSTPWLALEAARAGYRVLVASNNPIITLLLEVLAAAPPEREIQAALAELANSRRLDERLEVHVQALYQTECAACGQTIQADAYLWRRGEQKPYGRVYHCPACGDEGEKPASSADESRLTPPGRMELHRARAIERISEPGSPLRAGAVEAMEMVQPRALYVISTILNRIEGLNLPESRRKILWALAVSMLDAGNMLWSWPEGRARPRQLSVPAQFRENNLWLAFEQAAKDWPQLDQAIPVTHWPELPPEGGGICIYSGRVRSWLPLPKVIQPAGAVAVVPRPSQAFWTFSAVWAGWLWGREAVFPLRGALERRRYDWQWHAGALHHTLNVLNKQLPAAMPIFLICPEIVPGFASAVMAAVRSAGYRVSGQAVRADVEIAQWVVESGSEPKAPDSKTSLEEASLEHVREVLRLRNEPSAYIQLHLAALNALARHGGLPFNTSDIAWDTLTRTQNLVSRVLGKSTALMRSGSQAQTSESGWWWLAGELTTGDLPLADRVEQEIVRLLINQPGISLRELDEKICKQFPGWLTVDRNWVETCLASYAEKNSAGGWGLKPGELPVSRRQDLVQVGEQLALLAEKLGYQCSAENPWEWSEGDGRIQFRFFGLASSMIARFVLGEAVDEGLQKVLVIPGSRVGLVLHKLQRDFRLQERLAGWHVVKFRHLKHLAERTDMSRDIFLSMLDSDPMNSDGLQERMF